MNTVERKPEPSFVIRLVGPSVRPWVVPMRSLTTALEAVQGLIDPVEKPQSDAEKDQDDVFATLHLLAVTSGSAQYTVAARTPDTALAAIRIAGKAIKNPDSVDWEPTILSPIQRLSALAKSLHCTVEIRMPGRAGQVLATIGPTTYKDLTHTAFITGETSVYGRVEKVGGVSKIGCGLRIPDQENRMVICECADEDVAQMLGERIYKDVFVSGTATWLKRSWRMHRLRIRSVEKPKSGSILDALRAASAAGASAWDHVEDPRKALEEIRGE